MTESRNLVTFVTCDLKQVTRFQRSPVKDRMNSTRVEKKKKFWKSVFGKKTQQTRHKRRKTVYCAESALFAPRHSETAKQTLIFSESSVQRRRDGVHPAHAGRVPGTDLHARVLRQVFLQGKRRHRKRAADQWRAGISGLRDATGMTSWRFIF